MLSIGMVRKFLVLLTQSDGDDKKLLGHENPEAMAKIYQKSP